MIANYHTHTPRCHHAWGQEEAYVHSAIAAGQKILGFSDHTPYPFPQGYVSSFRMLPEELDDYASTVLSLREQYAHKIQIHLGVEAEFYPQFFPEMLAILRDRPIEYMILGQHMLHNEIEGIGSGGPTASPVLLRQYCDQCIDALYTGLFTYFAHPDLMCFIGDRKIYRTEIRRLCRAANECGVPLEINLLGIREGRHYPTPLFWEIAAEENCPVILGCDAHRPESLLDTASEQQAMDMVNRCGMTLLETIPLRPIK